jgi:hypothetical protein
MLRRLALAGPVLPARDFDALATSLMGSPLVGQSTLNGPFEATRGFAMTFTAAGRATVELRQPALAPYLFRVLGRPAVRALTPWWSRVERIPNAWYLNLLVVPAGAHVTRHVDATLREPAHVPDAVPRCVSVLYLNVPQGPGGELILSVGKEPVAGVRPRRGHVVHFRGDLAHEVKPFEGSAGEPRASLVIEQYHFEDEALARLPAFRLDSRANFAAHLQAMRRDPSAPVFEVE